MTLVSNMTIQNERGLHARAAAKFVKVVGEFDADIQVEKDGADVSGDSIMGLMMLAASKGTCIRVTVTGSDEEKAMAALSALVNGKFNEC
jgi:phosphocarrier protein HPr